VELSVGNRKPLLRLTVGSGADMNGTQASGTPKNSTRAFSKYIIFSF
jgi:hypothetical protein